MMGRAAAPAALFALGITLARRRFAGMNPEFPVIVGLKMFAHPVIVLAALGLIGGFDPLWISVAVLMAALPTAASVYVFAEQYDAYLEGASSSILVTTLVSAVTVPALLYASSRGCCHMDCSAGEAFTPRPRRLRPLPPGSGRNPGPWLPGRGRRTR
jgi:malonate transporter and related proteins